MGVHPDGSRDFDCVMVTKTGGSTSSEWALSLCQLWKGDGINRVESFGGLYSEFQDPSLMGGTDFQGSAYLLLNNSLGVFGDYAGLMWPPGLIVVAEASKERGEWLDLLYSNGSVIFSASICYAAFDFANIDVSISSQSNRTESHLEPVFDRDTSTYTFQELRYAMGQDRSLRMDRPGVLELAKGTWQVAPKEKYSDSPYSLAALDLRMTADLAFTKTALSHIEDASGSFVTGLLRESLPCSSQNGACVLPEKIRVSIFLRYRLLPHQCAVPLVNLSPLVGCRS